ncbi:MAG: hypothetical protein WDN01_05660 [Rhizomicrobium sp.]
MDIDLEDCLLDALGKAERAEMDIANFDKAVNAFLKLKPFSMEAEKQPHAAHQQVNLVVRRNPIRAYEETDAALRTLSADAKSIMVGLWGVLDDIVQRIALPGEGRAAFPASFGKGPQEPARFQREIARFPEDVGELIRSLDPHGGRDGEPFWILRSVAGGHMKQILEVAPVPSEHLVARLKARRGVRIGSMHWHPTNQCLVLLVAPHNLELNDDFKAIPLNVVFRGIKVRAGKTATQTLAEARELVVEFIRSISSVL